MSSLTSLFGYTVFSVSGMVLREQVRFPRSKKHRIQKKWAKRECNWRTTPRLDYLLDARGHLYAHPVALERLRKAINREQGVG